MKNRASGISRILARMTILPLMVFGIVTTIFSLYWVTSSMEAEVHNELQSLAGTTIETLDLLYPGDYKSYSDGEKLLITKGDTILNLNYQLIDSLKSKTNVEYTIFYGDLRVATTLCDKEGHRISGTTANQTIINDVYKNKKATFYKKVDVFGSDYFAYYAPIYNSDQTCVGMLAVLISAKRVQDLISKAALPILILSISAIIITFFWSNKHARNFTAIAQKMENSLQKVSSGTLTNTVPLELLSRKDEFGSMAHSLVEMQSSLRMLIEQDALTRLSNRRFGQQKLDQMTTQSRSCNSHFCVALGDIDFFKQFNDTYGHDCGDIVLQTIAHTLQNHVKDYGYCIRWGGEEFLIVFKTDNFDKANQLMEDLIRDIRDLRILYNNQELQVTMTFGLCDTIGLKDSDEIVKQADTLLYYGKEHGRNQLVTASSIAASE